MTTQALYEKIIARLDDLDAWLGISTEAPWGWEARLGQGKIKSQGDTIANFTRGSDAALVATSRNLLPGMLAYFRGAMEEVSKDSPEYYRDWMVEIARALGIEVTP